MALKVPRQLEHAVHPTLCYLYAYLHTGVFEHDENFERIIAKVPDGLRYVNQAQLAKYRHPEAARGQQQVSTAAAAAAAAAPAG